MRVKYTKGIATLKSKHSYCTLQDRGRRAFTSLAVPMGGPMDQHACDLANGLLCNGIQDAVLEIAAPELILHFSESTRIAWVAGPDEVMLNGKVAHTSVLDICGGDEIKFCYARYFAWRYLAIEGGWQGNMVLGSRSSLLSLGMPSLQYLSSLPYNSKPVRRALPFSRTFYQPAIQAIPIYPGPDFHYLQTEDVNHYFAKALTLDAQSNRHAYRLKEKITILEYPSSYESVACVPGLVQLTPSGDLFVLMKDAQTMGGYLQVFFIPPEHLALLAQRLPASKVEFRFLGSE